MDYRQGDVILHRVKGLPKEAKTVRRRLRVRGETGNNHVLEGEHRLYRSGSRLYVVVEAPSKLTHPEHPTILVRPGTYEVRRVRSFELAEALSRASARPPILEIRD